MMAMYCVLKKKKARGKVFVDRYVYPDLNITNVYIC